MANHRATLTGSVHSNGRANEPISCVGNEYILFQAQAAANLRKAGRRLYLSGPEVFERLVAVAEAGELDAHFLHDREVEAAGAAGFVAFGHVVKHAAGFEGATGATGEDERHLVGTVGVAVEQVRAEQ